MNKTYFMAMQLQHIHVGEEMFWWTLMSVVYQLNHATATSTTESRTITYMT